MAGMSASVPIVEYQIDGGWHRANMAASMNLLMPTTNDW
jgi:hypothetical protein